MTRKVHRRQSRAAAAIALAALSLACAGERPASPPRESAPAAAPLLTDCTASLGLPATPAPWPDGRHSTREILGPGLALFDADGDGDLDLLQLAVSPPDRPDAPAPNRLWLQGADGRFAEAEGLGEPGHAQAVAVGDADGDGDPDVYFANYGPDSFHRNLGDGRFEDATEASGLRDGAWSSAATFCDHDLDGDLDLFVVHYVEDAPRLECTGPTGERDYCSPIAFQGVADSLWINDGTGRFHEASKAAGIAGSESDARAKGLGVTCMDLTGDGRPDYYVANDRETNQLWVNRGDGTFVDEALVRGLAVNAMGTPEASMGIAAGDADGDGRVDLLLTHFAGESNTLYLAADRGRWRDGTSAAGLGQADFPLTGFGCALADFDLDGDPDLAVGNGRVLAGPPASGGAGEDFWSRYAEPNLLFVNEGGRFRRADDWAPDFTGPAEVTRGLAVGDLDGDGDLDLVTSRMDGSLRVHRNGAERLGHHWLKVRALDSGIDALGAVVRVRQGERWIVAPILSTLSYQTASEPVATLGLGARASLDELSVRWTDGELETFPTPAADRSLVLRRGEGTRP